MLLATSWLSSHSDAIIAGCISSAIVLGLQIFVPTTSQALYDLVMRRWAAKRVWGFRKPDQIYIVSGSIKEMTTDDGTAFLAGPDAEAVAVVTVALQLLFPKAKLVRLFSPGFSKDLYGNDLVTVGGPVNNSCTAAYLDALNVGARFENLDLVTPAKRYEIAAGKDGTTDYGLIISAQNPYATDRRCIVVAGCDTHGVLAAANTLAPGRANHVARRAWAQSQSLPRRLFRRSFNYWTVVKTRGFANTAGPSTVCETTSL